MKTEELIKLLNGYKEIQSWYQKFWEYPNTGDDPKKCMMLDAMLNIEHREGYIIFIPGGKKDAC
jgi:hypothetical protein